MSGNKTRSAVEPIYSDLVDRIYEVALDPERYEQLIDEWMERIGPAQDMLNAPKTRNTPLPGIETLSTHSQRARQVLERSDTINLSSMLNSIVDGIEPSAAFIIDQRLEVRAANSAAQSAFRMSPAQPLANAPIPDEVRAELATHARACFERAEATSPLLRFNLQPEDRTVIFRIRPIDLSLDAERFLIIVSNELVWPTGLSAILQEAFGLTEAEVTVVRMITQGASLADIASERGRSQQTVKTQLRAVFGKTSTRNQAELVRTTLGLMDVVGATETSAKAVHAAAGGHALKQTTALSPNRFITLQMPNGRKADHIVLGDPNGKPILLLPMDFGFIRLPFDGERHLEKAGLQLIAPVRPGFGATSQPVKPADRLQTILDDTIAVLDHHGIDRLPCIALSGDVFFAYHLAQRHPGRLTAIMNAGSGLPVFTDEQYARMDKWHRFILANAHHAPGVLPFLVRAGFALARRIGKEGFVHAVFGKSAADIDVFDDPQNREAILLGSEICLSPAHSAHEAFAGEVLLTQHDWSDLVHACDLPVHCWYGDEDPQVPVPTMAEIRREFPRITYHHHPAGGQLIYFKVWREILETAQRYLP